MGVLSVIWGVFSLFWMLIAFLPFLGWGNWLVVPLAGVGLLFSVIAQARTGEGGRRRARTGMLLNAVALLGGMLRLVLGGGVV